MVDECAIRAGLFLLKKKKLPQISRPFYFCDAIVDKVYWGTGALTGSLLVSIHDFCIYFEDLISVRIVACSYIVATYGEC